MIGLFNGKIFVTGVPPKKKLAFHCSCCGFQSYDPKSSHCLRCMKPFTIGIAPAEPPKVDCIHPVKKIK